MTHVSNTGYPKLVSNFSLPLIGRRVVDRIITYMGVFDFDKTKTGSDADYSSGAGMMVMVEIAPAIIVEHVRSKTGNGERYLNYVAAIYTNGSCQSANNQQIDEMDIKELQFCFGILFKFWKLLFDARTSRMERL
jgi:hypothetical protein